MALEKINPTKTQAWNELKNHFSEIKNCSMMEMFSKEATRAERFSIEWNDFLVDYSKNRIDQSTMDLLFKLAEQTQLKKAISSYFKGDEINSTEKRAVLHTALRAKDYSKIQFEQSNTPNEILEVKKSIEKFTEEIINGKRKGFTGKKFTDVVNIGIGGSDLGPAMVVEALQYYKNHLQLHFISNIDADHVAELLQQINPETTLFVVVSKTFTTQETLTNAKTIKNWFLTSADELDVEKHFVAVSTNNQKVTEFGINTNNIFPMWDWVGGRFSLWSAVGLSISLSIGFERFEQLLAGAEEMDRHFETANFDENIPVILGLLSIWYINFFGSESEAIIPYSQYLKKLTPYLQQAVMESNGKSIDREGKLIDYQTGSIIWGEPGTNAQHAFFQLIHQGTKLIPVDFIGFVHSLNENKAHHSIMMANFFAQTEALLNGKTQDQVENELAKQGVQDESASFLTPFKTFEGNKPTTSILIQKLTPKSLGSLLAMYEHKIFVQGVIWNIYSYDQWGVELGKELASTILDEIQQGCIKNHDSSTTLLLNHFLEN
jgi:glucose-6-phosphate isomerase